MNSIKQKKYAFPLKLLLSIPVPWVFVLNYLIGLLLHFAFPFNFLPQTQFIFVKISGIVLFAIGAFLAIWSLLIFRKFRTTTTPGESSKKIVTEGPYRFSRNPMYVSLILAYLGEAGFLVQIWPVIVLPLVLVYINRIVIPLEEEILKADFKEEYVSYSSRVNRWL